MCRMCEFCIFKDDPVLWNEMGIWTITFCPNQVSKPCRKHCGVFERVVWMRQPGMTPSFQLNKLRAPNQPYCNTPVANICLPACLAAWLMVVGLNYIASDWRNTGTSWKPKRNAKSNYNAYIEDGQLVRKSWCRAPFQQDVEAGLWQKLNCILLLVTY